MQWQSWQQSVLPLRRPRRDRCVRSWYRLPRLEYLEARLPPAAHDTLRTAISLPLDSSGEAQVSGNIAEPNQVILYAVKVPASQQVGAEVQAKTGSRLEAAVRIFDSTGVPLTASGASTSSLTVLSYDTTTGGTYYIGVSSTGDVGYNPSVSASGSGGTTSGRYTLDVTEGTPHDTLATAIPVSLDSGPQAQFGGNLVEPDQVNLYAVNLSRGDELTASIDAQSKGNSLQAALRLLDGNGSMLTVANGSAGSDPQLTFIIPATGVYYVGVSSVGDVGYDPRTSASGSNGNTTGVYSLTVNDLPARFVNATALNSSGQVVQGTLTDGDPQDYSVTVTSDTLLFATVLPQSSPGFQPHLTLYDGTGKLLIQSDKQAANLASATVQQHLLTGTYYLELSVSTSSSVSAAQEGYGLTTVLDSSLPSFAPLPVGNGAGSVAVADLTGDGIRDIVTSNAFDNTVSVLLGNGDGTFQKQQTFAVGQRPESVAVADLNGDGIPDIVTANTGSFDSTTLRFTGSSLSVLLGNGDGTFQPAHSFAVGNDPVSVAVADLTGDGIPDIVTANLLDDTVSVLLGNGDGTFQPAHSFTVGKYPHSLAVANLTGDGIPGIVTANPGDNTVSVLLGNGDGTFQSARSFAVGNGLDSVAVADLTGDGIPDIVTANVGNYDSTTQDTTGSSVSVLLGNGDGTFQPAHSFAVGKGPEFVAVANLTGDGIPDIVTANDGSYSNPGSTVSVLLGNGDGTFQPAHSFAVGNTLKSVAVGDLTGDGIPDIVTANFENTVSVLLGNGDGTFQLAHSFAVGTRPNSVAVADLTGDGIPDIVTSNALDNTVSVLLGNGDGTFQLAHSFAVGTRPESVAVADLNGDGIPDIVTANFGNYAATVSVLLGNGDGTFQLAHSFAVGKGPEFVAVANLTGDGIPDIVTANFDANTVSVLLGNGDGTFQPAHSFAVGKYPVSVAVADLTGDGIPDIVTANESSHYNPSTGYYQGTVSVLLGNGDGTFQPAHSFAVGAGPDSVAVADLTGDGIPDIVTPNALDNTVSILLGNGDGTFQPAHSFAVGAGPNSVAVADLTGDGIPDIVTPNGLDNTVSVLLGNGDGTFQPAHSFGVGEAPVSVAVATLTGDGIPDIVTANYSDNTVSVLLGNGHGSFFPPGSQTSIPGRDVPRLADLNGDGIPDALSLDQKTGQILFRAGTGSPSAPYAPFLVVNPKYRATDFTLVQTTNPAKPEIAALDAADDTVYLYAWTGANSQEPFSLAGTVPTGGDPVRIASADVTGNGLDDLVIANGSDDTITIAFQLPSGTSKVPFGVFNPDTLTRPVGSSPSNISFAVVEGQNGPPDIVVSDQGSGDVTVLFNNPEHTFTSEVRYRAGPGLFDTATSPTAGTVIVSQLETVGAVAVPLTTNTPPDLLAVNAGSDSFSLLTNLGNGSFADPTANTTFPLADQTAVQVLVGDFTPHTTNDLAILTNDSSGNSEVRVYLNNGYGTLSAPIISDAGEDATGFSFIPGSPGQSEELLIGNAYGDFLTLTGDDSGGFAVDRSSLTGEPLAVGHTDGTTFVVVTNADTGHIQVFTQNPGSSASGSSPFTDPVSLTDPAETLFAPGAVQLADLNRAKDANGKPIEDLIVADRLGNDVLVFFGKPDGTFPATPSYSISVGFEPSAVTVGDFNGDKILDLAVANEGSNDVSILDGQLTKGLWTATPGPRLASDGSEPIAISAGHFIHPNLLDLRVTNAGGQVATLPGIGSRQGTGFFLSNHPQTINLGSTIVQSAFDPSTGAQFVVLQDGSLRSLDGAQIIASGVDAVSATDGILIAGLADGEVEVMTETGADAEMETPGFIDQPSALQALLSGNQIDVYATYQGQQAPVLFSFAVPVITELPTTSAVAQASGLADTNLILAAVLLQGNLVERVEADSAESVLAEETSGSFTQITATRTAARPEFQDAAVEENISAESPQMLLFDGDVPVEAPLRAFRLGVDEALRQWLRDQQPAPRIEDMMEALEGMLVIPPALPDQPPTNAPAAAGYLPVQPTQPAAEPADQAKEQDPWEEITVPRASAEAEVEVFTDVDLLPVLAVVALLMDNEEDDQGLLERRLT